MRADRLPALLKLQMHSTHASSVVSATTHVCHFFVLFLCWGLLVGLILLLFTTAQVLN